MPYRDNAGIERAHYHEIPAPLMSVIRDVTREYGFDDFVALCYFAPEWQDLMDLRYAPVIHKWRQYLLDSSRNLVI